jgi:AraC-like DNA-binding protein
LDYSFPHIDVQSLVDVKRRLIEQAVGLAPSSTVSRTVRQLLQVIGKIAEHEPRAASVLLLTTAEELRQAIGGSPEHTSVLHATLACPGGTVPEIIARFKTSLTAIMERRPAQRPTSDRVRTILDIIERRYVEPLKIGEIAEAVCRGRAHVAAQFRRETGLTIHRYLTLVRIRRAAELLEGGEKVEAVMLLVGYRSKKSFYFHFRAHTGRTPGSCRRQPLCSPSAAMPARAVTDSLAVSAGRMVLKPIV